MKFTKSRAVIEQGRLPIMLSESLCGRVQIVRTHPGLVKVGWRVQIDGKDLNISGNAFGDSWSKLKDAQAAAIAAIEGEQVKQ